MRVANDPLCGIAKHLAVVSCVARCLMLDRAQQVMLLKSVARAICSSDVDDLATDFLEIDDELDDTDFE